MKLSYPLFYSAVHVRKMIAGDVNGVADIHRAAFVSQQMSSDMRKKNCNKVSRSS